MPASVEGNSIKITYPFSHYNGEHQSLVTAEVVYTKPVPDDLNVYTPPVKIGSFELVSIEGHPDFDDCDPVQERYPDLDVYHYLLVLPRDRLYTSENGHKGLPFHITLHGNTDSAVVFSYQGLNPITLTPARPEMGFERVGSSKTGEIAENWLILDKDKPLSLYGISNDPLKNTEKNAAVRQSLLSPELQLSVARVLLGKQEARNSISLLIFNGKIFIPHDEVEICPVWDPDETAGNVYSDAEYVVAAGGKIKQSFPKTFLGKCVDYNTIPSYFHPPQVLVRLYPVNEETVPVAQREIEENKDHLHRRGVVFFKGRADKKSEDHTPRKPDWAPKSVITAVKR